MADAPLFELNNLCVSAVAVPNGDEATKSPILDDVSLTIERGETALVVGTAGSGKTALAKAALGSPQYDVSRGTIRFQGDDITGWPIDVRAKAGLFLALPATSAPPGITVLGLLQAAANAGNSDGPGFSELHHQLTATVETLGLSASLLNREIASLADPETTMAVEVLQVLTMAPELAIIDLPAASMTDEAIELLAVGLAHARVERPEVGTLIMSRYDRLLDRLEPDNIHVLSSGRITASDSSELAANGTTEGNESLT